MSKTLLTNLEEIKNQKDTLLIPENIKSGVTILGIQGSLEASNQLGRSIYINKWYKYDFNVGVDYIVEMPLIINVPTTYEDYPYYWIIIAPISSTEYEFYVILSSSKTIMSELQQDASASRYSMTTDTSLFKIFKFRNLTTNPEELDRYDNLEVATECSIDDLTSIAADNWGTDTIYEYDVTIWESSVGTDVTGYHTTNSDATLYSVSGEISIAQNQTSTSSVLKGTTYHDNQGNVLTGTLDLTGSDIVRLKGSSVQFGNDDQTTAFVRNKTYYTNKLPINVEDYYYLIYNYEMGDPMMESPRHVLVSDKEFSLKYFPSGNGNSSVPHLELSGDILYMYSVKSGTGLTAINNYRTISLIEWNTTSYTDPSFSYSLMDMGYLEFVTNCSVTNGDTGEIIMEPLVRANTLLEGNTYTSITGDIIEGTAKENTMQWGILNGIITIPANVTILTVRYEERNNTSTTAIFNIPITTSDAEQTIDYEIVIPINKTLTIYVEDDVTELVKDIIDITSPGEVFTKNWVKSV